MHFPTPERDTVLHSWSVQSTWNSPTVVGGEGAWFFTDDGRRILDMSSQSECSNLGHQHPAVVRAIQEQAAKLSYIANHWGAAPRAELAELLLEKSGFAGGRVFFTLGGADANENAVKLARQVRALPRGIVIARDRSYHGATYAAMALSGDARTRDQVDPEHHGVVHSLPPYGYRSPFGPMSDDECGLRAAQHVRDLMTQIGPTEVAAIIAETNAGTNGVVPADTYWPALRQAATDHDVLLIADEVMSGFGRCGEWFAWQRFGEAGRPDLMTLAKGLTGAHLPLGAVVVSRAVAERLENELFLSGLTYCGHPLCCAAGVAAVRAYDDEKLIERSRQLGSEMLASLQGLQRKHRAIGDVRGGHGLFAVIEFVADRETRDPGVPWPQAPDVVRHLVREALAQGVSLASRGNLLLLAPPLVIEEEELADAIRLIDRLLTAAS